MNLEDEVVSLEVAKKLKELGVKQESLYVWSEHTNPATLWREDALDEANPYAGVIDDNYSAFTVVGIDLPYGVVSGKLHSEWYSCCLRYGWSKESFFDLDTRDLYEITKSRKEADARGKLLIYLLENNLISLQ